VWSTVWVKVRAVWMKFGSREGLLAGTTSSHGRRPSLPNSPARRLRRLSRGVVDLTGSVYIPRDSAITQLSSPACVHERSILALRDVPCHLGSFIPAHVAGQKGHFFSNARVTKTRFLTTPCLFGTSPVIRGISAVLDLSWLNCFTGLHVGLVRVLQ
jgi:hypothetical protein